MTYRLVLTLYPTDLVEYIERPKIRNVDSDAKASRIKIRYNSTNRTIIGSSKNSASGFKLIVY